MSPANRLVSFVLLSTVACSRGRSATPANRESAAVSPTTVGSPGEVTLAPDSTLARWLSDASIVSLGLLLNAKQVAAANVELGHWHSDTVRTFAEAMLHEHSLMARQLDSLATSLHLKPVAPALAEPIGAVLQAPIDSISGLTSRALEGAYLRQQVTSHQALIDYATQLGAAADQPQLQALLAAQKARFREHLSTAQTLQRAISISDSTHLADSLAADSARAVRRKRARTGG